MATLIICPACDTRYEIAATLPPEGRKVRCSKCGHTWQATGVEPEASALEPAPPEPQAPRPEAPPVVPVNAAMRGFAGIVAAQPGAAAGAQTQGPADAEGAFGSDYPPEDAGFGAEQAETDSSFEAEYAAAASEFEAGAEVGFEPGPGTGADPEAAAGFETETEASFEAAPVDADASFETGEGTAFAAEYSETEASFETGEGEEVRFGAAQAIVESDADFAGSEEAAAEAARFTDAFAPAGGSLEEDLTPPTAEANVPRDLSAMIKGMMGRFGRKTAAPEDAAMGVEQAPDEAPLGMGSEEAAMFAEPEPRKASRAVSSGWALLALILLVIFGIMALAPSAMVSAVPGTARLYAMMGMPVNLRGLAIQDVTHGWTGQGDLEIKGNVVNITGDSLKIPLVVIALRDADGEEVSEWTTEVSQAPLGAGQQAQFWTEIPAPPDNVRSVKVHFATAN